MNRKWMTDNVNFYDFIKNMTTLSTAALVFIVTFAEKFAANSEYKIFFIFSIVLLLTTIFAALLAMFLTLSIQRYNDAESIPIIERNYLGLSLFGMFGCFSFSLISICIFAIANI